MNVEIPPRESVDLTGFPSAPVQWIAETIDTICYPLQCKDTWRLYVPYNLADEGGPLSYSVGRISDHFPRALTFSQYTASQASTTEPSLSLNLYNYAFHTSSTALGVLTTPTALVALLLLVLIFREIKSIVTPKLRALARKLGKQTHGEEWLVTNEERINKFAEYVIRLIFHCSISVYGILHFHNKVWWDYNNGGTVHLFYNYPHHEIEPGMAWYYLLQSAYNTEALILLLEISLTIRMDTNHRLLRIFGNSNGDRKTNASVLPFTVKWKDSVRGDFREMMIHHIVTNLLIFGSSFMRFTRIGSMVFLLHDLSDIPVDLSKLSNFVKWNKITMYCFCLMIFMWFYTRLYILPFVVYRSILFESYLVIVDKWTSIYYICYRPFFDTLIVTLIALHSFWFALLIKIGYDMAFKGECNDYTEHTHGENEKGGRPPSPKKVNEKKQR